MPVARRVLAGYITAEAWRRDHPADAARWAQAYAYVEKHPGELALDRVLNALTHGEDIETYAQRARSMRAQVEEARAAVSNGAVDAYLRKLIEGRVPVTVSLAGSAFTDVLQEDLRTRFRFAARGPVKKLKIVSLAPTAAPYPPESIDPALAAQHAPIPQGFSTRAVVDPRPLAALAGKTIRVTLRNGLVYRLPLAAAGRFDLVLGTAGAELLVPLHAIVRWEEADPQPGAGG